MRRKRIISVVLSLALVLLLGGELLLSLFAVNVSAASTEYSGVMEDLNRDNDFDETLYPHNAIDYSLRVIQIAESIDGVLYVYVYQPAAPTKVLLASSIAFSTGITFDDRKYEDFELSLIASQGVFQKYKVNGFKVRSDEIRYYAISEIFRPFDSSIDTAPTDDNTIDEKAFKVGQLWDVSGIGSDLRYGCTYEDVIDVTEKHVGFIRYEGGIFWFNDDIDSHYVAFDTDRPIDKLLEVDIKFHTKTTRIVPDSDYGNILTKTTVTDKEHSLTLTSKQVLEGNTSGFFPESYKYNRVQSIDDFIKNEGDDLKDSIIKDLDGMKWVLRFYESSYTNTLSASDSAIPVYSGSYLTTTVSRVALFRICYEYDSVVYNLGVVDDKQSGDNNPDNKTGIEGEDWWQKIMAALMVIILLIFVWPFVSPLISILFVMLWDGVKFLVRFCIRGILWVLTLPFRIIGWFLK